MYPALNRIVVVALQGATSATNTVAAPRGPLAVAPFQSYEPVLSVDTTPRRPRAIEHNDLYYVRQVVVDLDRLFRQDQDAAEWDTAFVTL